MHRQQQGQLRGSTSCYHLLSWRGLLDSIKLVCDHVVGNLAPSSHRLKQLGQYASSPGHRGYCYAELADFFPNGCRNHR